MYGFPALPGAGTVKLASERYAETVDPDRVERAVTAAESAAFFTRHVAGRLHGVTSRAARAAACLYTVTPDSGFIVDVLAGHPHVLVASACSGHGFKHSAALGELLAARALDGAALPAPFSLVRYGATP